MSGDNLLGGVQFGVLHEDGRVTDVRVISHADIRSCPAFMLMPEHYRADGSCRCDDPTATSMHDLGYRWSERLGRWT